MLEFLKKMMGGGNEAQLKKLKKPVDDVMALEEAYKKLTDDQLRAKTDEFRARLQKGETEDDLLPEAFATVREAADRVLGMRPYRVQVLGGVVLHQGRIAEMKTGEGKTLTATLPAYLNALTGQGVHIVTVNDYLEEQGYLFLTVDELFAKDGVELEIGQVYFRCQDGVVTKKPGGT